tara:strand:+ start:4676 stop:4813 length:138 start_codon:yes stop_codon:yes gene_type:complete
VELPLIKEVQENKKSDRSVKISKPKNLWEFCAVETAKTAILRGWG